MLATDRKTRKLLTTYRAHHPKTDVDRLYLKRSGGGRGLIGVEDCVSMEIHSLKKYLMLTGEKLLEDVLNSRLLRSENATTKEEIQKDHETLYTWAS